jgi:hypothetical protein
MEPDVSSDPNFPRSSFIFDNLIWLGWLLSGLLLGVAVILSS